MSYIYLSKKAELKKLTIFNKFKFACWFNNISFVIYKCNEKLIIQSTDFLVQSAISKFSLQFNAYLSFESFHCGIKCNINNLSINGIYTFSRLSHIHEALRYLNSSKVTLEKGKVLQQQKKCNECNLCWWQEIYNWDYCLRIWIFWTLKSSLQLSEKTFWTSSARTLTRLISKVKAIDDSSYIKHIFTNLSDIRA